MWQEQGYLCTQFSSGIIQPIFPGLSWLVVGCESYSSVALSQVQYLQHCAVLLAQLHPVSVLLDIHFKLITQEWLFSNIKQALLGLQSFSGMPGLCLGLELAEDCYLSAFSQLFCRSPKHVQILPLPT